MTALELLKDIGGIPRDQLAIAAFFTGGGNQLANISEITDDGTKVFLISTWEEPALTIEQLIEGLMDHAGKTVHGVMPFEEPVPQGAITGWAANGPKAIQFHVGEVG
jgi:hypothetical protein